MRLPIVSFLILFLSISAFAADLKVKVVDPQSAAVARAQVSILDATGQKILAAQITSSDGTAEFRVDNVSATQLDILAPGFAEEKIAVSNQSDLTIHLRIATASETVVVSATRTPVPGEAAGASVDTLGNGQLTTLHPIAASGMLRVLPGAVVNAAGQRGGISSLFVRGGESTYNKVIVDGVAVDTPGQTTDFGIISLAEADRIEFVRGAQSTLYGSDAMTSVLQVWTRTGSTPIPELRFGADGGNFGTANGYASLSGAWQRFDYNAFANQFATNGQGINNHYSQSLQGANVGMAVSEEVALRVRVRHSNSYTGLPGEWNFNGNDPLVTADGENFYPLPPDPAEYSHQNNLLGSVELSIHQPSGWQHRLTAFDYLYRYHDINLTGDDARITPGGFPFDYPTLEYDHINRIGFEYQGDYSERTWVHTTFGYWVQNENGMISNLDYASFTPGQRLENDFYVQQQLTLGRLGVIAGGRLVHNSDFGNIGLPRVALTLLALRGGEFFSGTRLRFSYATGFMEPALYQVADGPPYYVPNPGLLPERTRAFEAGIQQNFLEGRWVFNATYFNNLFHDQIEFAENDEGVGQFFNVQKSLAHGAELQLEGKISSHILFNASYTNLSTQYLQAPLCTPANFCDPVFDAGNPLLRRPKQSGTALVTYLGTRWGGSLGASVVGRRPDSDFEGFNINHAAGYALVDLGFWRDINHHVTAYANAGNVLNQHYNEVVGYPAITANIRAGFRFRFGGER
ncbi:MAG TPA: TonB-dependent receptor [Terriglobales bacterium]|nr:TonB-dependent receptor [Terriglobales bacterium]